MNISIETVGRQWTAVITIDGKSPVVLSGELAAPLENETRSEGDELYGIASSVLSNVNTHVHIEALKIDGVISLK